MKQARGDVRQILIGMYTVLEKSGAKDIVARVRKGARAMGYAFSDHEASEWLKPFQLVRARETHGKRTGNALGFEHETHGKRTGNARETHSRANKVSLVTKLDILPLGANAPSPPTSVQVEIPKVVFEPEDEARVEAILALEVMSDKMRQKTRESKRMVMRHKLDLCGALSWRHAMDTAIAKPAGWKYVLGVLANNPSGPPVRIAARGAPDAQPAHRIAPEKLAEFELLLGGNRAIRQGTNPLDRIDHARDAAAS